MHRLNVKGGIYSQEKRHNIPMAKLYPNFFVAY
jgi:hypothetical protein